MRFFNYRSRFLLKNLFKGFFALTVIVVVYILLQKHTPFEAFIAYLGKWPELLYAVFISSEIIFGIIPPEFFMIWSIDHGAFDSYILDIALLSTISYGAGVFGYFLGTKMESIVALKKFFQRYIKRYSNMLNRYGGFLIFVGAVTPVPFSATCMLVGATHYNFKWFLIIACSRFVRFAVYSAVIYQANI